MTLDGSVYNWYKSYNAGTFSSWQESQVTFIKQFYLKMGQQNSIMFLSNIKQGVDEDIMFYFQHFRVVYIKFVNQMFVDHTIRHYFIQGFNKILPFKIF
jgi:hypothetical protein